MSIIRVPAQGRVLIFKMVGEFEKLNTLIFALSKDTTKGHMSFIVKNDHVIELMSNPDVN